jgi:flagellar basal body-associated protein FliL
MVFSSWLTKGGSCEQRYRQQQQQSIIIIIIIIIIIVIGLCAGELTL